jgi:hypothetical protein
MKPFGLVFWLFGFGVKKNNEPNECLKVPEFDVVCALLCCGWVYIGQEHDA